MGSGTGFVIADITATSLGSVSPGVYSFQLFGDNSGTIPVQVSDTSFVSLNAGSPTFSITVVPEPSVSGLFLGGFGALLGLRALRRR
ncbi:MAG: PEP-CTERM sorting domain-containing protein [Terrimicrobiaceae bacterium]|nr:PEP-CTERM sorting domain-containing protein [Terrimicrobiaceae bacterium]